MMMKNWNGVSGDRVTISNVSPRLDVNGTWMDAHDGNIFFHQQLQLYLYYSVAYGDCKMSGSGCDGVFPFSNPCGFLVNHSIVLYSSSNLYDWKLENNDLLPFGDRPSAIYYRPKVIYNKKNQQYVMWLNAVFVNWVPNFMNSTYVVATSSSPFGPFHVVTPAVTTLAHGNPGDFTVFVDQYQQDDDDDDETAYIAYDAFNNFHTVTIEQLNDDYTATLTETNSGALSKINNEAPILFHYSGYYYLMFGQCCCFCKQGSNSHVMVAESMKGPWTDTHIDIDPRLTNHSSISQGQESFIVNVVNGNATSLNSTSAATLIFVSDRWMSAPDNEKGHDFQFWAPLHFDHSVSPPLPRPLHWIDTFDLDIN